MAQISMFDGDKPFKIDKPIRLIELFAGYGSQHLSLKYLGANCKSWRICEWAVKSIQAYKDLHFSSDRTDYSKELSFQEVIDFLTEKGISANYNEPMTSDQIKRMGEQRCRTVYNNIKATNNLVNIQKAKASDLNIVDTDKYCYLLTYSFPCQDLSKAGKGKGMEKGSGTRSGMLWEVERLLDECSDLPQVLLMENVPDVIGTKNIKHFAEWLLKLESLGYKNYWKVMNGKNYGIPQNRDRCFMVSILGDYYYEFADEIPLEKRLKDILETDVDEKFYLNLKTIEYFVRHTEKMKEKGNGFRFSATDGNCVAKAITTRAGSRMDDNFINCEQIGQMYPESGNPQAGRIYDENGISPTMDTCTGGNRMPKVLVREATQKGYAEAVDGDSINLEQPNSETRRGRVGKGVAQTLTTSCNQAVVEQLAFDEQNGYVRKDGTVGCLTTDGSSPKHNNRIVEVDGEMRIRKLTPKECWRLMGVKDEDFEKVAKNQSNSSLYHLAGDSIITNVLMAIFKPML